MMEIKNILNTFPKTLIYSLIVLLARYQVKITHTSLIGSLSCNAFTLFNECHFDKSSCV